MRRGVRSYPLESFEYPMSAIQQQFDERIAAMSPRERVARSAAMLKWVRDLTARQIRKEHPDACEREVKLRVGLRMYGAHPAMVRLLEGLLDRVSDRRV